MSVRSEFRSQLLSYAVGGMDLKSFREWHLSRLLDPAGLDPEEMELLHNIEGRFADHLAGAPESGFKDALKALVSGESQQAPMEYVVRSYVISASPIAVEVSPFLGQPLAVSGSYTPNEAIAIRA